MKRDTRLDNDEDFIVAPKYQNSIKKILEAYPDGVPDSIIKRILKIKQEQLDNLYKTALIKIRSILNVE